MAITTLDGLIGAKKGAALIFKNANAPAVAAGFWASYWAANAIPGAGTLSAGDTTAGTIFNNATAGSAAFPEPGAGLSQYVMGLTVQSSITGVVMLYDRIFGIGALTPTSGAYAGVTGTALDRPANGEGVEMWAEIVTALSAAAHTVTVTYTDEQGNPDATATVTLPASAPVARMFPARLAGGDWGARRITGISGSASPPTGTFNLLLLRPIARVAVIANVPARLGIPEAGLRECFANSCLALAFFNPAGTTAPTILVSADLAEG
jgi:hypothetical protein